MARRRVTCLITLNYPRLRFCLSCLRLLVGHGLSLSHSVDFLIYLLSVAYCLFLFSSARSPPSLSLETATLIKKHSQYYRAICLHNRLPSSQVSKMIE